MQKQQMDWGAAERGGGTQPLFSLLSVCLHVFVCLPTFLSACLSVCLEMFEHSPMLLLSSCPFFFCPLPSQLLNSPTIPALVFVTFSLLILCLSFPHFASISLFPPSSLNLTSKLPFVSVVLSIIYPSTSTAALIPGDLAGQLSLSTVCLFLPVPFLCHSPDVMAHAITPPCHYSNISLG